MLPANWRFAACASLAALIGTTVPACGSPQAAATRTAATHAAATHAAGTTTAAILPLAGKVVGIDPGHDGGNFNAGGPISKPVWNGRAWEACDTTGTRTASGYSEALFNFRVAEFLRADLIRDGA